MPLLTFFTSQSKGYNYIKITLNNIKEITKSKFFIQKSFISKKKSLQTSVSRKQPRQH